MTHLPNTDVRLTDALERQLIQEAIEAQQREAFQHAVRRGTQRLVAWFKTVTTQGRQRSGHAHQS